MDGRGRKREGLRGGGKLGFFVKGIIVFLSELKNNKNIY